MDEYSVFRTRSGLNFAMREDLYNKLIENDKQGYTYGIAETYIVAEQYFPQIVQFIAFMITIFNGYTSFTDILGVNMIVGIAVTLLWNNSHIYRIPGLAILSLMIGGNIFRLFIHFIIIALVAFIYFKDWKIFVFSIIAGFITQLFKSWFSGYKYTIKHNNDIAEYTINMVNKNLDKVLKNKKDN